MKTMRGMFATLLAIGLLFGQASFVIALETDLLLAEDPLTMQDSGEVNTYDADDDTDSFTIPAPDEAAPPADGERVTTLDVTTSNDATPTDLEEENPEEENPDVVYNEEALAAWCGKHVATGGTVYLGQKITLTKNIIFYYYGNNPPVVIVDTGKHGMVYDGGSIILPSFEITGEGVDAPVLTIKNAGAFRSNEQTAIQNNYIAAYGRDGIGGTAVRFNRADTGWPVAFEEYIYNGLISSVGNGAVGIEIAEPMDLYCFNVEVSGENSVAVSAPDGSGFYFCKFSAYSADSSASVISSGDVFFDTCRLSPVPEHGSSVNRRIISILSEDLYLPLKKGLDNIFYSTQHVMMTLSGTDEYPETTLYLPVQWDESVMNTIDINTVGRTLVSGRLAASFDGLCLDDDFPIQRVVDVRDPALPCISNLLFADFGDSKAVRFSTWSNYESDPGFVALWRSDDGGESWYDISGEDYISWGWGGFVLFYTEPDIVFMLQIETLSGESNVVTYTDINGVSQGDMGGDRTGADRIIGKKPGSEPETPPVDEDSDDNEPETPPVDDNPGNGGGNTEPPPAENGDPGGSTNTPPDDGGGQDMDGTPADGGTGSIPVDNTSPDDSGMLPVSLADGGAPEPQPQGAQPEQMAVPPKIEPALAVPVAADNNEVVVWSPNTLTEIQNDNVSVTGEAQQETTLMEPEPVPMGGFDAPNTDISQAPVDQSSSPFSTEGILAVVGGAAVLLIGAALWIRRVKLRAR